MDDLAPAVPPDLRQRLEEARLRLLALFRALDQLSLSPRDIPQDLLHELFTLDADYAEALWGLDQPPETLNVQAMIEDTLDALQTLPDTHARFRASLPSHTLKELDSRQASLLATLGPAEAYSQVPGRDPDFR